jgi:hypothetical protein
MPRQLWVGVNTLTQREQVLLVIENGLARLVFKLSGHSSPATP